jgi:hypothetical protein
MMKMLKNGNGVTLKKDQAIFTASDFFFFLSNIDELNGHKIRLRENIDGSIQIFIDKSVYTIWQEDEVEFE